MTEFLSTVSLFSVSHIPVAAGQLHISSVNLRLREPLRSCRTLLVEIKSQLTVGLGTSDSSTLCAVPPFMAVTSYLGFLPDFPLAFFLLSLLVLFFMSLLLWEVLGRTASSCSTLHLAFTQVRGSIMQTTLSYRMGQLSIGNRKQQIHFTEANLQANR